MTVKRKRRHVAGVDPRNPFLIAQVKAAVKKDMDRLQTMAGWEAWVREKNPADLVAAAARVLWITDRAAHSCRLPLDSPDMRIIAGAANALGDLAKHPKQLDLHRGAIQSGILAAQRLWPLLDVFALGYAALDFEQAARSVGIGTQDFNSIRAMQQ